MTKYTEQEVLDHKWRLADNLYRAGFADKQHGRDYDPRGCKEWEDVVDMLTAYADLLAAQPVAAPDGWKPMRTAPRDGTLVRLLVAFDENATEDSSGPAVTIGTNTYDSSGEEEWYIAGWNWEHDCFTAGKGTPIGWLPMLDSAAPSPAQGERSDMQFGNLDTATLPAETRFELGLIEHPSPAAEGAKVAQPAEVLSDEQLKKLHYETLGYHMSPMLDELKFARAIERAVLAQPSGGA